MAKRKRILVPCGSGVATSNMAAEKLKSLLKRDGFDAEVQAVDFKSLATFASQADIIVSVAPHGNQEYPVPVINGIPLLTGVGLEQCLEEIEKYLKQA
jgi:PTS system galactitol-specific IIB component